jgi:hypothetical protein
MPPQVNNITWFKVCSDYKFPKLYRVSPLTRFWILNNPSKWQHRRRFKDLLQLSLGLRNRGAGLQAALLKPCRTLHLYGRSCVRTAPSRRWDGSKIPNYSCSKFLYGSKNTLSRRDGVRGCSRDRNVCKAVPTETVNTLYLCFVVVSEAELQLHVKWRFSVLRVLSCAQRAAVTPCSCVTQNVMVRSVYRYCLVFGSFRLQIPIRKPWSYSWVFSFPQFPRQYIRVGHDSFIPRNFKMIFLTNVTIRRHEIWVNDNVDKQTANPIQVYIQQKYTTDALSMLTSPSFICCLL